jgi:hypothetical protein
VNRLAGRASGARLAQEVDRGIQVVFNMVIAMFSSRSLALVSRRSAP